MFKAFETPVWNGKQNSLTGPVITGSFEKRAPGHKNVSDFVQNPFVSATNVSQFARARKRHEQQCFRNNVSSFATTLKQSTRWRFSITRGGANRISDVFSNQGRNILLSSISHGVYGIFEFCDFFQKKE